jgi:hypothetical protein
MKQFSLVLLIGISNLLFSQDIKIEVHQNSKKVRISNNEVTLLKSPFCLVYKFKDPFSASLISGSDSIMKTLPKSKFTNIQKIVGKSGFGGADGYFNEDLSIRAWNNQICTAIFYEDGTHHSFDSLYRKGKIIYGFRTIEKLSTPNDNFFVEGWKDKSIILATTANNKEAIAFKVNFRELSKTTIDVRGKEFIEVGEATWQHGCEGCGNLGSFHFLINGKDVDFLLSGSDTGSFGGYKQSGNQINISNEFYFTVSEDGKSITNHKHKTVYTIKDK